MCFKTKVSLFLSEREDTSKRAKRVCLYQRTNAKNVSKIWISLFLALFIGAGVFSMNVQPAEAASLAELQQYIEQLKSQIVELQKRLTEVQQGKEDPGEWCHTFNRNLRIGDRGADVQALETALVKQGFSVTEHSSNFSAVFDEKMASAVVGFQEKYTKEVLAQWGLTHGTGFVGKSTRAKLNQLYGCSETPDPILTCAAKCEAKGYDKGVCRTWVVVPDTEWGCRDNEFDIGQTSDCTTFTTTNGIDEIIVGVGKTCCCQKQAQEECAGEGEQVNRNPLMGPTDRQCCEGLVENRVSKSYSICEKPTEECAKEGEEVSPIQYQQGVRCCDGLKEIIPGRWLFPCSSPGAGACGSNGCSIIPPYETPHFQCAPCGNEECESEYGENKCNCPEDCAGASCRDENYECTVEDIPCCSGLKEVGFCFEEGEGCICATCGSICRPCGNGVCDANENKCNCPEDCEEEPTPSITVTYPNGGEEWVVGQRYEIKWEQKGLGGEDIYIGLLIRNKKDGTLISGGSYFSRGAIANQESYHWFITDWQVPEPHKYKYKIVIARKGEDITDMRIMDESDDYFSIVAAGTQTCTDTDGGIEKYVKGTTCRPSTVNDGMFCRTDRCIPSPDGYAGTDMQGYLTEYYCKDDKMFSKTIKCENGCANGACKREQGQCAGEGEQVNRNPLMGPTDRQCCEGLVENRVSKSYSICEKPSEEPTPSITVTSPNGGEEWAIGETYDITWDSQGLDGVNIVLCDYSKTVDRNYLIAGPSISAESGKYTWIIYEDIIQIGDKYKIMVVDSRGTTVQNPLAGIGPTDASDDYFSIVEAGTQTCTDTDGGKNYYVKGTLTFTTTEAGTGGIGTQDDVCIDGSVMAEYGSVLAEYYCDCDRESVELVNYTCPNGCADGACIKGDEPYCSAIGSRSEGWYENGDLIEYDNCDGCYAVCKAIGTRSEGWHTAGNCDTGLDLIKYDNCGEDQVPPVTKCTDTDGGENKYVKGTACRPSTVNDGMFCRTDRCIPLPDGYIGTDMQGYLTEYYCKEDKMFSKTIKCENGCANGACKREQGQCAGEGEQVNRNPLMGPTDRQCCEGLVENRVSKSYSICEKPSEEPTPSITVISPNGGEELVIGETYEIRWEAKNVDKIMIQLNRDKNDPLLKESPGWHIAYSIPASPGSYSWTLGDYPIGHHYKIEIWDTSDTSVKDASDDYFSIVAPELSDCHTSLLWDWDYCSPGCKCSVGEGDCDTDVDCADGLFCAKNVGTNYGQDSRIDVCEKAQDTTY